jgi:mono/diheme cytochrome c family protein
VTYCMSLPRLVFAGVVGVVTVGLSGGCSEKSYYPADLRYPLRTDVLVTGQPAGFADAQPWKPSPPGTLDAELERMAKEEATQKFFANPMKIDASDKKELRIALQEVFGTPFAPSVEPDEENEENRKLYDSRLAVRSGPDEEDVKEDAIEAMALDRDTLKKGSGLYRRHCLHCHGLAGDGRGPTGPWVNPHPRDYRQGKFKFISTNLAVANAVEKKPRRADLLRTISRGIESSSMPAFGLLPEKELEALVSYVIHLSLRGQVEYDTMKELLSGGKTNLRKRSVRDEEGNIREHVYDLAAWYLCRWTKANDKGPNTPPKYPEDLKNETALQESIRRGYKTFTNAEGAASCINCHMDFGRQVPFRYDDWGTLVRPANLTVGVYRGGRRPIDLYWRITNGIGPSQMPAGEQLKPQEVWDLVNFVQNMPYPAMLPEDVREKIYSSGDGKKSTHAHAGQPEAVPGG